MEDNGCDGSERMSEAKPVSNLALLSWNLKCLFTPKHADQATSLILSVHCLLMSSGHIYSSLLCVMNIATCRTRHNVELSKSVSIVSIYVSIA